MALGILSLRSSHTPDSIYLRRAITLNPVAFQNHWSFGYRNFRAAPEVDRKGAIEVLIMDFGEVHIIST